jgi:tRNA threonylcarbamoyladenosine biosynthesis protein TsaE
MSSASISKAAESIEITTFSPEETRRFGEMVGQEIDRQTFISLAGDLGSGKTVFVQGLARGLGVPADDHITSPTYALVNEYSGRMELFHADLYRISGTAELSDIGFDEFYDADSVLVVEWADRLGPDFPGPDMAVSIRMVDDFTRKFTLFLYGRKNTNLIKLLQKTFDSQTR